MSDAEIAEIENTIATDGDTYRADPAMQQRYLTLLEEQGDDDPQYPTTPAAAPSQPSPQPSPSCGSGSVDDQIAEIEAAMKADFAAYRADEDMQERYTKLLEAQESGDHSEFAPEVEHPHPDEVFTEMSKSHLHETIRPVGPSHYQGS